MTISVGDKLPETSFTIMGADGPTARDSKDIFDGKTVVLFAVPGAFTPTCHSTHLPGFLDNIEAFKAKGVDEIACTAINDVFVMDAWGKSLNTGDKITLLADGAGSFAKATGLDLDLDEAGLGLRSKRYAMLVVDGTIKALNIEDNASIAEQSSAQTLLDAL
ncbi:MAG: peroxiredoxin [Hyphomicrobiaceae bacterium]|nr:peroxiredoxin [Hyphomicrobiaceae bacterium]